ncbi:MAG: AMP-binding protein [Christensenellales bacterium]|jgi:acetyl-CoA synthetase
MKLYEKYLKQAEFSSYEDFMENFEIRVPEEFNFAYDVVDYLGEHHGDSRAIVWCNEAGQEREFTFRDIMKKSNQAANLFRSLGVKKGDHVMLILKRHYQFWFCMIALHKIGAIGVPGTHLLTTKDLIYRNNYAGVNAVVCTSDGVVAQAVEEAERKSPDLRLKLMVVSENPLREGWLDFDELMAGQPDTFEKPTGDLLPQNGDTMLAYFTSGTTGYPKLVRHDFTYPLGHIVTATYWQNVVDGGLHLTVSDTGWAKSVWGKLYGQWLGGSAVMVYDYDKFVPEVMLGIIQKYKINTFCAPPTIYRFLIREDMSRYDLSSLQYCVIAGEALNPEIYNRFLESTGIKLMEGFGQTEMTVAVATFPWMQPRPGSMGKPSPQYHIDLVDEDLNTVDSGVTGEIIIRPSDNKIPGLFVDYYKAPELNEKVWEKGVYHTGDIAWRDEQGYFWYVGRMDDVIKSSGYRIGPFEVESALMEHDAVVETAVTGVPDEIRGQLVKATVVLAPGYTPSDELVKELQDYVKNNTAPYKYPRIVEFVDELPKTISGKIRRVELRERDQQRMQAVD